MTGSISPKVRRSWRFLHRAVRREIDRGAPSHGRWQMIVVHGSSTKRGSANAFDYYHRNVKGMRDGLAYHFVIGNGSASGDGEIEVGGRWSSQTDGGHLLSAAQNEVSIGICLVGDFNRERVSANQLEALDELLDYLKAKVGDVEVTTHSEVTGAESGHESECPGKYFPGPFAPAGQHATLTTLRGG